MINTAVIVAGGKGLRLGPETADKPKAMVKVLERPIIEWIILWLKKNGVSRVVISVDYKKEVLMEHLGDGHKLHVNIVYNDETGRFLGTGGAFRNILDNNELPERFFAMNGDQITDLSLQDVAVFHNTHAPTATIVAGPVQIPFGIIELSDKYSVAGFREKPVFHDTLMNTGIYVFEKTIKSHLPKQGLIEKETFTELAKLKKLKAYPYNGFYTTINNQKDIAETERRLKETSLQTLL